MRGRAGTSRGVRRPGGGKCGRESRGTGAFMAFSHASGVLPQGEDRVSRGRRTRPTTGDLRLDVAPRRVDSRPLPVDARIRDRCRRACRVGREWPLWLVESPGFSPRPVPDGPARSCASSSSCTSRTGGGPTRVKRAASRVPREDRSPTVQYCGLGWRRAERPCGNSSRPQPFPTTRVPADAGCRRSGAAPDGNGVSAFSRRVGRTRPKLAPWFQPATPRPKRFSVRSGRATPWR